MNQTQYIVKNINADETWTEMDKKICNLRESDNFQHDVLGKYEEDGLEEGLDDNEAFEQAIDRITEELTEDFSKYDHYLKS